VPVARPQVLKHVKMPRQEKFRGFVPVFIVGIGD
jgi:hypothetical protein